MRPMFSKAATKSKLVQAKMNAAFDPIEEILADNMD